MVSVGRKETLFIDMAYQPLSTFVFGGQNNLADTNTANSTPAVLPQKKKPLFVPLSAVAKEVPSKLKILAAGRGVQGMFSDQPAPETYSSAFKEGEAPATYGQALKEGAKKLSFIGSPEKMQEAALNFGPGALAGVTKKVVKSLVPSTLYRGQTHSKLGLNPPDNLPDPFKDIFPNSSFATNDISYAKQYGDNILNIDTKGNNFLNLDSPTTPFEKSIADKINMHIMDEGMLSKQEGMKIADELEKNGYSGVSRMYDDKSNTIEYIYTKGIDANSVKPPIFEGFKDLSTRLLEKFKGMPEEITLQQFNEVLNRAKKMGIKIADENIIKQSIVQENGKINLSKTATNVERQLVPLTPVDVKVPRYSDSMNTAEHIGSGRYFETVYQSPIKTSAGDVHYPGPRGYSGPDGKRVISETYPNYFSHVRGEEMADGKSVKLFETQSDLMQKDNFAREGHDFNKMGYDTSSQIPERMAKRNKELMPLQTYNSNDPLAHLRTFREFANDWFYKKGKTRILVPTGETAMKIEGLGQADRWILPGGRSGRGLGTDLVQGDLKVGLEVANTQDRWIITDILGDGKFKAVPRERFGETIPTADKLLKYQREGIYTESESFDISGKVDKQHFVYKLNENAIPKEARKEGYIVTGKVRETNTGQIVPVGTKTIESNRPGEYWEILKGERPKHPVSAFGLAPIKTILGGALAATGIASLFVPSEKMVYEKDKKNDEPKVYKIKDRPVEVAEDELKDFGAVVFGEATTSIDDMRKISNVIINRANASSRPVFAELSKKSRNGGFEFNAYTGKQYNKFMSDDFDFVSRKKAENVNKVLEEIKNGTLADDTDGAIYFSYSPEGKLGVFKDLYENIRHAQGIK